MLHPKRIKLSPKSSKKRHKLLDLLVYSGALFGPLVTIPQIYTIWISHKSSGVSLISWGGYLIGSIVLFVYGIVYDEPPIAITNFIWVILNGSIVLGLLLFH